MGALLREEVKQLANVFTMERITESTLRSYASLSEARQTIRIGTSFEEETAYHQSLIYEACLRFCSLLTLAQQTEAPTGI